MYGCFAVGFVAGWGRGVAVYTAVHVKSEAKDRRDETLENPQGDGIEVFISPPEPGQY